MRTPVWKLERSNSYINFQKGKLRLPIANDSNHLWLRLIRYELRYVSVSGKLTKLIFVVLQNLQERIASLQNMFETLSSTEGELRRKGVSLSPALQNRIDQLYRRWKQLQIQLLQRQHAMQEAYSSIDMSSIQGLQG